MSGAPKLARQLRLASAACVWLFSTSVQGEIAFAPCELKGSNGYQRAHALCGSLVVPEDRNRPAERTIELFVAKVPSLSPTPQSDAFTVINGGPGASSVALYVDLSSALDGILPERDIIVMDQRGTGASNPLNCPSLEEQVQSYSEAAVLAATERCLAELPGDPRYYATSQAVADLEALREASGYDKLNLYGVSYGTRVALHYLRRYPDRVRSLVIDGVVPPDLALGVNVAQNAQATLDQLIERCRADAHCGARFADLEQSLTRLRSALSEATVAIEIPHPLTGQPTPLAFGHEHLAISLRLLSYAPETAALIPLVIDETARGNYQPAASMALQFIDQLGGALSFGMHNAVVCTEDLPFIEPDTVDWKALEATYLGADQVRALITMCNRWPTAELDAQFKQPVQSDVPTLVLSGEIDPITPPAYGEAVAAGLTNSVHIVARGQGHGIIARGCVPRVVSQFVSAPDPNTLDSSCTERLMPSPFFLNLLGPAP